MTAALALLLGAPGAQAEENTGDEADVTAPALEHRVADKMLLIRVAPDARAALRGRMAPGAPFEVLEYADEETSRGCRGSRWARVTGDGWVCLRGTAPTEDAAVVLPQLVAFDPPEPAEWETYLATGTYARSPASEAEALLPFVYGKRWRDWTAPAWPDVDRFLAGEAPDRRLGRGSKYAFVEVIETEGGTLLRRADGQVVPADQVHLYPADRFQGRDLEQRPLVGDRLLAWVFAYDGAPVRAEPGLAADALVHLPYHHQLEVVEGPDGWFALPGLPGADLAGWIRASALRVVRPAPPPPEVGPEQLWLDVDLDQQVVIAWRGDRPVYATLVSTGTGGRYPTPRGLYRIVDKAAWWEMSSRRGAAEHYHVENVPWTMHFHPRYALHGVFWHWGFGHVASHGCVNLAPKDARWIFERVSPRLGPGWLQAIETEDEPGTLLRVRRGADVSVPDRRR